MLLNILMSDAPIGQKILYLLIAIIALFPALTFHEWAHGYMAYKLGDHTAKADGRLSLNPLDHIDPIGTLMMFLIGFGWAKPVPINTRNFKKPKRDIALTSAAGPLINFIAAFIFMLLYVLCEYIFARIEISAATAMVLSSIFFFSASYNIGLGLFNLIPLPPLDGSNVLMCLLPSKLAMKYSQVRYYTRYIFIGIIVLSYIGVDLFAPLDVVLGWMLNTFRDIAIEIIWPFFEFI